MLITAELGQLDGSRPGEQSRETYESWGDEEAERHGLWTQASQG